MYLASSLLASCNSFTIIFSLAAADSAGELFGFTQDLQAQGQDQERDITPTGKMDVYDIQIQSNVAVFCSVHAVVSVVALGRLLRNSSSV